MNAYDRAIMDRMSKKKTGNDDHGKWTSHEYENAGGEHGYIISGGLLPDDAAVNRKARELGHDIDRHDWMRIMKTSGETVRYFYSSGAISDELIEDELKAIGPFYDLSGRNYLSNETFIISTCSPLAILIGAFMPYIALAEYTGMELACLIACFMFGSVTSIIGFELNFNDGPCRRIVDGMGAAIISAGGTPVRVRASSALRRALRRFHVKINATPEGWNRVKRNGKVLYIHENADTPTFVSRDDAIDLVLQQVRDFGSIPSSASHLITATQLKEPSASTVIDALQNIIEPSAIPSAVSTLNAEQSRAVMARLRTRMPER
jgi:hypothetical protein